MSRYSFPDPAAYYLMRVAQRVQQSSVKQPNSVTIQSQLIDFDKLFDVPDNKNGHTKATIAVSKSRWRRRLGQPIRTGTLPAEDNIDRE